MRSGFSSVPCSETSGLMAASVRHGDVLKRALGLLLLAYLLGSATMPLCAVASIAGEVVFSVGNAQLLPQHALLQRGIQLREGDVIVTEAGAHVHIRFSDGALVSVRPNSRLSIERYRYQPGQPSESAVKFRLESGTARSITGKAGEESKDRFRLNTPVAAIGVRGTDFVVVTDAASSAVAVNTGAVVVSPLGDGCAREALGPCAGALAKELTASMTGTLARVEAGKVEFMAIRELQRGRIAPPAESEPKSVVGAPASGSSQSPAASGFGQSPAASSSSQSSSASSPSQGSAAAPSTSLGSAAQFESVEKGQVLAVATKAIDQIVMSADLEARKQRALEDTRKSAEILNKADVAKLAALSPSILSWGRWSQQTVAGDIDPAQWVPNPDYSKLVMSDGVHALFGPAGSRWSGAREGLFEFSLRDAKVYLRESGGMMSMGTVSDGKLTVDLAAASFKTQITGLHQQVMDPIVVKAEGYMRDDGSFRSSLISAANVTGVLANGGREAAYAFSQSVSTISGGSASFAGLTRWGR